jgi:hypothetical protein
MKYIGLFTLFILALKLSTAVSFFQDTPPDYISSRVDRKQKVPLPKGKFFLIQNNQSGKCIDSSSDDVKLVTCDKLNPNQKWKIERNPKKDNPWIIITNSLGKRLDNKNGSQEKGNRYWKYDINWTPAQSFKLEIDEDDNILINEGSKLCLDSKDDYLIQEECKRNNNQKWTFIKIKTERQSNNEKSNDNGKDKTPTLGKNENRPRDSSGKISRVNNQDGSSGKGQNSKDNKKEDKKGNKRGNKKRFQGYYQIRNSDGKCIEDTMADQKMRFGSCNVYEDGFYFKMTRNKNNKAYYIYSALGNMINYQDGTLMSRLFKKEEKQLFKIKTSKKEGLFRIKTLDKNCLTNQQGNLILSPCKKSDDTQYFQLFSYQRLRKEK